MTRATLTFEQVLGLAEPGEEISQEVQFLEQALLPLHGASSEAPAPDLWDRIETAIDREDAAPGSRTIASDEGVWEQFAPGIERKVVHVDRAAGTQAYFVRMAKGAILPGHDHASDEHCVVLDGALEIGGDVFGKGTYHFVRDGMPHGPIRALSDTHFFIQGAL